MYLHKNVVARRVFYLFSFHKTLADDDEQSIQLGNNIISGSESNLKAEKDGKHLGEKLGKFDSYKQCTGNNDILEVVEDNTSLSSNVEMNGTGGQVCGGFTSHEKVYDNNSDIHVPVKEGSMVGSIGNVCKR